MIIFTAQGNVKNAVEAMRRGAVDFLEKPFSREQFHLVLARVRRFHQLSQSIKRLEQEVKESNAQSPELLLDSTTPLMGELMETLLRAAKTPASILIMGESGTGKSVISRAVHQQSHLSNKPFVTVSCPSLSKELLESDLRRSRVEGLALVFAGFDPDFVDALLLPIGEEADAIATGFDGIEVVFHGSELKVFINVLPHGVGGLNIERDLCDYAESAETDNCGEKGLAIGGAG